MKTRREFFRKLFGAVAGTALAMKVTATNNHVPQRYRPDETLIHLAIAQNEQLWSERDYCGKWRFVMDNLVEK